VGAIAIALLAAAGGSSLLALVNGPVGPGGYSPELANVRERLPGGSTLVVAPTELLDEQHGRDYLVWELRGNRICVEADSAPSSDLSGFGNTLSVAVDGDGAVVLEGGYDRRGLPRGSKPCPFIPDGARADPARDG
jgi:hypothetical protein